ncbi:pimeloyl-ACP methyl ester carboxylesterase [Bradyrhizobium sp. RT9b]|uniref:alpha/beta hydrolase n=1 Tax=Bradyrhizobium sp. RT9b TaxID=3156385 RepID=UPI003391C25C
MEYRAGPHARGDLASTRRDAAAFLDNLTVQNSRGAKGRQNWIAIWTKAGDSHCLLADLKIENGMFGEATEAWLCALTAFEVARRLVDESDAQSGDVLAKVEAGVQRFVSALQQKMERVEIACCDQTGFLAHYLPADRPDSFCPAVICISDEEETGAMLLGRLLPVVIGRGMSVLVVSREDLSNHSRSQSESLSNCLDFLSTQPDVDAARIGVYGDGLSAALATDFAASDRRVAAAVCDGGLWKWTRTVAFLEWMTRAPDAVDQDVVSTRRSQLVRRIRCPVLVVAGRGIVSVSHAIQLQADCMAARIDLELVMPRVSRAPEEEVENFVTSDDCVFGWLDQKLARNSTSQPSTSDQQI